jgi:GMP synthase (glutamine-hydrolysing)
MTKRIVLITHSIDDHNARDDRASDQLASLGYTLDWKVPAEGDSLDVFTDDVAGTIVYGGKYCISDIPALSFMQQEIRWLEACMKAGVPVLGACQGAQMIAHILGAPVGPKENGGYEFGYYPIKPTEQGQGFLPAQGLYLTQAHFHEFQIPASAVHLARSEQFENQAFRYGEKVYGFQFHAEVTPQQFRRWQDGSWGQEMYGKPGAQSRELQDRLGTQHDAAMDNWFREFINKLFKES